MYATRLKKANKDKYFFKILEAVTSGSSCMCRQVGAIIVSTDGNILSTGYNGTPIGVPNCNDGGCQRCTDRMANLIKSGERLEYCLCNHAESNSIVFAARNGVRINGAIMYTQGTPCSFCAKEIINSGISEVVVLKNDYPDKLGEYLLSTAHIVVRLVSLSV